MRRLLLTGMVIALAAPAVAGGMSPPVMEDEVVVTRAPASTGALGADVLVPALMLLAVAAVVAK